jgi:hypothetical protein
MRERYQNEEHVTWLEFIVLAVFNTLAMIPNNLTGIIMFSIIGSIGGWLLGLSPVGTWIAGGLKLIHVEAQAVDIYKLGALLGFTKGFLLREPGTNVKRYTVAGTRKLW